MQRLDNAMTKAVNEMLKDARNFAGGSDITKCLNVNYSANIKFSRNIM